MEQIKVGVLGYGNIGKGVEYAVSQNPDLKLEAVFTRRDPSNVVTMGAPVYRVSEIEGFRDKLDVLILCGGSATDLPKQGPEYASMFNTVDSFDTHARIPEYFRDVDKAAAGSAHTSLISIGWDPGLFSLMRYLGESVLPEGSNYTFWGKGVSQGHSDAIRRIAGVKDARQYTVPVPQAVEAVRTGSNPSLTTRQKHTRECFVVAEEGADKARIEKEIKEMPNYFDEYDTSVTFITEEEMKRDHSEMPHGGFVIRSGKTADGRNEIMEFSLSLKSNPQFTASVLVAYARACMRLNRMGMTGAKTILDVPPVMLSPMSPEDILRKII
ncbi:MAG: diaminopimelate dehydrogenase [Clostridia bacterium]|nr:diaminopimelate dehydrogenase [Clostridia bacterium]